MNFDLNLIFGVGGCWWGLGVVSRHRRRGQGWRLLQVCSACSLFWVVQRVGWRWLWTRVAIDASPLLGRKSWIAARV